MDLVLDANILFAALIKESVTSNLLIKSGLKLYSPEFVFEEFRKHKQTILRKTKRSPEDFERLFNIYENRIVLVPFEDLKGFEKRAEEISLDNEDILYFALALKLGCPIWSNDKLLQEQDTVEILPTHELIKMI